MPESRLYNSEYYDAFTTQTNDTEFYCQHVLSDQKVLELGCGTGRVSLALAKKGAIVTAVDISRVMLDLAEKERAHKKITYIEDNITQLSLNKKFDLIIAPFRVM